MQLSQIQPASIPDQPDLFDTAEFAQAESGMLMQAMDRINRRCPKSIVVAATGFDKSWKPKAERISRRYTTDWGRWLEQSVREMHGR